MNWQDLLNTERIGQAAGQREKSVRSEFQRDGDRIQFCASFRRMQDKTQVFPLAKNDYLRRRLTHSLEVACVGRSLGSTVGVYLLKEYPELSEQMSAADIGDIVSAACLAHDLGNPPFGHAGEQAMRDFFTSSEGQTLCAELDLSEAQKADFAHIEGNAQGFRICNTLEGAQGGLRLTYTTLATAAKYPTTAYALTSDNTLGYKKNGVYQADLADYARIFTALGLKTQSGEQFLRHPLSYLMEAADDICYLIVDVEDAYQIGEIDFNDAFDQLYPLTGDFLAQSQLNAMRSSSDKLAYLRAKAIGNLVEQTVHCFKAQENAMLTGNYHSALIEDIASASTLQALRQFSKAHIYNCRAVLEIQVAGHRVLNGLLRAFVGAYVGQKKGERLGTMLWHLLPHRYRLEAQTSDYHALLAICDYISGMTDSYAVTLYKKITGISLPN